MLVQMNGESDLSADHAAGAETLCIFAVGLHGPWLVVRALRSVPYIHAVAGATLLDASIVIDNYPVVVDL